MNELDKAAIEAIDSGKLYYEHNPSILYLGESIAFLYVVIDLQSEQICRERIWVCRTVIEGQNWDYNEKSKQDHRLVSEVQEKLNAMRQDFLLEQKKNYEDKEIAKINALAEMVREGIKDA